MSVAPGSDRVRLARVVLDAVLAVPDVLAVDSGPRGQHATASAGGVVRGVLVVAAGGGTYTVDVGVRARMVALPPLADAIRERIRRSAQIAGDDARLGAIGVTFHDVLDPEQVAATAESAR